MGALVAVVLGVGAFSFLGGGTTPPPAPATATAAKDGDKKEDGTKTVQLDKEPPKNPLFAANLPQRDPFQTRPLPGEELKPQAQQQLPAPTKPPVRQSAGRRSYGGDGGGYRPVPLSGQLPLANGNVSIAPSGPDPSTFGYTVSGTMTGGKQRVAVFTDSNGNQRMVPEGGSLDGDSKVVAIEKGSVTIEHRGGRKQRLSLGGNPK
jgi:hypothetical protein